MKLLVAILFLCLFSNCTVDKRLYRPGYSVSFHHKLKGRSDEQSKTANQSTKQASIQQAIYSEQLNDTVSSMQLDQVQNDESENTVTSKQHEGFVNQSFETKNQQRLFEFEHARLPHLNSPDNPFAPTRSRFFNGILAFLIVLLGIAVGAILFVPDLIMALIEGQSPIYDLLQRKVREGDEPRTFKTIFVKSMAITIRVLLLLSALLLLTLLAIYFIQTYGWFAIVITVVAILLLLLLLAAISGDGLMRWLFIGWGK